MWWRCILVVALASTLTRGAQPSYRVASTDQPRSALLAAGTAAWKPATLVTWGPAPYETTFRALWSTEGLYLRFDAADDHPWHTMTKRDDHLWEEEVVEIFLDMDRSGRNYAELEISPGNVVCDVRMVEPWPNKQMDFSWNIEGLETTVVPAPGRPSASENWTALAFLPWSAFRTLPASKGVALPPRIGDRWRFNLFRVKRPGGPEAPDRGAVEVAWSEPGQPSFHVPAAFRDFVFEGSARPRGAGAAGTR
jgi:hypothetical protein